MKLKKCFGIISWFPVEQSAKTLRQERINRLLLQLNNLWPDIDILVIAQNWQDFEPVKTSNKKIIIRYDKGLGILKARKELREQFLLLDYDYIIMLDDDAIIKCSTDTAHIDYMNMIDANPNKFCFIHADKPIHSYDPYKSAQLNLCAISRYIYELEPFPDIDPQKNECYEDHIYSLLLHVRHPNKEFIPPKTITHIQWKNPNEKAPSTWINKNTNWRALNNNMSRLDRYICEHKKLPDNLEEFFHDNDKPKKPTEFKLKSYLDLFIG